MRGRAMVAVWILAVWLLSLALFAILMVSRQPVEHPRPPVEQTPSGEEGQERFPSAA
jgi:hypothetical protein